MRNSTLLLFSLAFSLAAFAQETPEAFLSALEEALNAKYTAKLDALCYSAGMSEKDRAQQALVQRQILDEIDNVESLSLRPLMEGFLPVVVTGGRRIETTAPPAGHVVIKFQRTGKGSASAYPTYSIIDDRYYLLRSKTSTVNWSGPADRKIAYVIAGEGKDGLRTKIKWNGSGVEQENIYTAPAISLHGQFIREISVTSESDDTNVTLTVLENDTPIFQSKPLKGRGTLEYKRPN